MNKILELLNRATRHSTELPCLVRVMKDDVRMSLLEYQLPCGHEGYRVDLEYYVEGFDKWVEIASLRDFNLHAAIELLNEAKNCIRNLQEQ